MSPIRSSNNCVTKEPTSIRYPVIEIEPTDKQAELDRALLKLQEWKWVVFLSRHGVEHTMRRLRDLGMDAPSLRSQSFSDDRSWDSRCTRLVEFTIGPHADRQLDGEGLAKTLNQHAQQAPILILRANRGRTDWIQTLEQAGHRVEVVECYRQVDIVQPDAKILQSLQEEASTGLPSRVTAIANNLESMFGGTEASQAD